MERVRAEGTGRLLKFGVKAGEGAPNYTDDDGGVVKNMGKEDKCQRRNAECRMQKQRKQSSLTEEGIECGGNDNRGKHEGNSGQCSQERFAAKIVTGKEIGRGKSEEKCKKSGKNGLVECKK